MGAVLVFAAGYVLGSRSSEESFDDVVQALRSIRESEEFHGLVKAVRVHAAESLRGLAGMLERMGSDAGDGGAGPSDLLDRVRLLAGRR